MSSSPPLTSLTRPDSERDQQAAVKQTPDQPAAPEVDPGSRKPRFEEVECAARSRFDSTELLRWRRAPVLFEAKVAAGLSSSGEARRARQRQRLGLALWESLEWGDSGSSKGQTSAGKGRRPGWTLCGARWRGSDAVDQLVLVISKAEGEGSR